MVRDVSASRVKSAVPRRADPPAAFLAFFGRQRLRGSISPSAVDAIAAAIQTQEGYYPGSVSYRNNNPGNLVYAGQPGATMGPGGFAVFSTYDQGLAAEKNQITLDATRGTDVNGNPIGTVSDLISSWAPASAGNNTSAYIASVSLQTGYDPNASLSSLGSPSVLTVPPDYSGADSSSIDTSLFDPNAYSSAGSIDFSNPIVLGGAALLGFFLLLSRL